MKPSVQTLTDVQWFAAFSAPQIATLASIGDIAGVGPNEGLVLQGAPQTHLIVLLSGFVVETQVRQGGDAAVDVIAPVAPIGLSPALLGLVSPTGARTITSARLLIFPAAELRAAIRADTSLAMPFLDHALVGLQDASGQVVQLKLLSATQRLGEFLLTLVADPNMVPARFVLPYEKRHLAARIGCSPESLSRAFAALRSLGVETQRGIVVMRDLAGLRRFVNTTDTLLSNRRSAAP